MEVASGGIGSLTHFYLEDIHATGTPPKPEKRAIPEDKAVCTKTAKFDQSLVVDSKSRRIRHVVISLVGVSAGKEWNPRMMDRCWTKTAAGSHRIFRWFWFAGGDTLRFWHEKLGEVAQEIVVTPSETTKVALSLKD